MFVTIITASGLMAQNHVYEVHGSLKTIDGKAIQFAHVVNINKHSACISDTAGNFRIVMLKSDTVKISCIGYETTGFSIKNLEIPEDDVVVSIGTIVMKSRIYELSSVSVYAERWKSFLYDYEQVPIEEAPYYEESIEKWKNNIVDINVLQQLRTAANGGGFPVNFNRKRIKADKKIAEFKRQDELNNAANAKYNPTIVSEITGLSIEESRKFIQHFNLDRDFIIKRNDYDIYLIVKQLYQEYSKQLNK